jgi:hypothetical protein
MVEFQGLTHDEASLIGPLSGLRITLPLDGSSSLTGPWQVNLMTKT